MARVRLIWALVLTLVALHIMAKHNLVAQAVANAGHEHLGEVACVDLPQGQERPKFGCFNVGTATGLFFSQSSVYWHLREFSNRTAADAVKSGAGLVVEEDGRVWLSEFGPRNMAIQGGKPIAVIGPMQLPKAESYSAVLSYAIMRPGDSSRVHTHPGPEGWYVLAGEQCLETPAGANKAKAGGTMLVGPNIPMELNVTGGTVRKAFALVIHDSTQNRGIPSKWKSPGACTATTVSERTASGEVDVFRRVLHMWESGDLSEFDRIIAADYLGHVSTGTRNREALRERIQTFRVLYPDIHFTVEDKFGRGEKVVVRLRAVGTNSKTGLKTELIGINISRVVSGRIAEEWAAWESVTQ